MKKGLSVSEAHVQQTVKEFLEWDGWRAFRTELTVQRERGRVVGEVGQPDYLFIRYLKGAQIACPGGRAVLKEPAAEVLWIEFKRKGARPQRHEAQQRAWHDAERARGALVMVVDDIDDFMSWYAQSGLQRNKTSRNNKPESRSCA